MENRIYTYIFVQKFNESIMAKLLNNEKKWQAEYDAKTMAEYQAIISDKSRMKRAMAEAKRQAEFLSKQANQMNKVADTSKSKKK